MKPWNLILGAIGSCALIGLLFSAQAGVLNEEVIPMDQPGQMFQKRGEVRYQRPSTSETDALLPQILLYDDRLRTLSLSSAAVRFKDASYLRMRERTRLEIRRDQKSDSRTFTVHLREGEIFASSGGNAKEVSIETPHARGVPKGTEFLVRVEPGRTEVTMFEGEMELSNGVETSTLSSGDQGIVVPGRGIQVKPVLQATNLVQWWIYYPGVLNPDEAGLSPEEKRTLSDSLAAYRDGDLQGALRNYPNYPDPGRPSSQAQALYLSALFLSVGAVDRTQLLLEGIPSHAPGARALRTVIAAVSGLRAQHFSTQPEFREGNPSPSTSSEWLAMSYWHQSEHRLDQALQAARQAVELAPGFGFAWARRAELEFSLGNIRSARSVIDRAVQLSPLNAQASAVRGFLLAAENETRDALAQFSRVIELDSSLPEGWLGRGLCRIRLGDHDQGMIDLRQAVIAEPRRSLLRSYLGKALEDQGDLARALQELEYARKLDPNDPTPWLYAALLRQRENMINEAVSDLQRSIQLNENRLLYRSRLQLDQDRGVRRANLALVYEDAGMADFSLPQAARAVNDDYANAAAHLFLANSYNALRDPSQINLRYETAWWSEWLMANLLAPVGASPLSPALSQHEYSRLFEQEGLQVASRTFLTSRGDVSQNVAQYGRFQDISYLVDALYNNLSFFRPNSDLETLNVSAQVKAQLGMADSLFFQSIYAWTEAGDVSQYFDPSKARLRLHAREWQEPIALAGWHHEWDPGSHSLFLVSPWNNRVAWADPEQPTLTTEKDLQGIPWGGYQPIPLDYKNHFVGVSTEFQQIWQMQQHTPIVGLRFQTGSVQAKTAMDLAGIGVDPRASIQTSRVSPDLNRWSLYAYDQVELTGWLSASAGLVYDWLEQPVNFRIPPLSGAEETRDQFSPKAGFMVRPWDQGRLRGAYSRSLSGMSFDQSYRLEPVHVAGFNQAYRGLFPESVAGSVAGQDIQTWGLAFEQDFTTRTFIALRVERLASVADRQMGAFELTSDPDLPRITSYDEHLDFREKSLAISVSQLVERDIALSARYRLSDAQLKSSLQQPLGNLNLPYPLEENAVLHEVALGARYNHPSGFFGRWESRWTQQSNRGYIADHPGDDFWQHDLWLGWRFMGKQAEVSAGLLNLTGQDYRLDPLNYRPDTYRRRTVAFNVQFFF